MAGKKVKTQHTFREGTLEGHSGTLLWKTLVGHSCRTLLVGDALVQILWVTQSEHSCGILSCNTLVVRHRLDLIRCNNVTPNLADTVPNPAPQATERLHHRVSLAHGHGLTRTHFPPKPRKTAWRSDITDVISPHSVPILQPAPKRLQTSFGLQSCQLCGYPLAWGPRSKENKLTLPNLRASSLISSSPH